MVDQKTEGPGGLARAGIALVSLLLAAVIWIPSIHLFFRPQAVEALGGGLSPRARQMANWQMSLWTDPEARRQSIERMRGSNAEWDFMGRTFFVLALANMALEDKARRGEYLEVVDAIIDETLRLERENGMFFFLMDYAQGAEFAVKPPRSLFIDGEIALMIGARLMVEDKTGYRPLLRERTAVIVSSMSQGEVMSAESYPNECWIFCNTAALAALAVSDCVLGDDHGPFIQKWLATARERLVEPGSGMLISSYTVDGHRLDGAEGSSIWWAAHCLQLIDEDFARGQYELARAALGRDLLGFGYAREWSEDFPGNPDIDSGPIVPWLDASAGSSGQALLAARTFGDEAFFNSLQASLDLAAFPVRRNGGLRYCASNQVGDAMMLYAMVQGPLWKTVREGNER